MEDLLLTFWDIQKVPSNTTQSADDKSTEAIHGFIIPELTLADILENAHSAFLLFLLGPKTMLRKSCSLTSSTQESFNICPI